METAHAGFEKQAALSPSPCRARSGASAASARHREKGTLPAADWFQWTWQCLRPLLITTGSSTGGGITAQGFSTMSLLRLENMPRISLRSLSDTLNLSRVDCRCLTVMCQSD